MSGVTPQQLQLMAGWHLKCWTVDAPSNTLSDLAKAAVGAEGLHVSMLQAHLWRFGTAHESAAAKAVSHAAVQQLCQGLQGLRRVVVRCTAYAFADERQQVLEEQQRVRQALQQALQGRDVRVEVMGLARAEQGAVSAAAHS